MFVVISNVSRERFGLSTNFKNSSDLLHSNFLPRHFMSLRPLVFQFAIVVKVAFTGGAVRVFQKSVTTGWRVGIQRKRCTGTGKSFVPTSSPNVNSARWRFRYARVFFSPRSTRICSTPGSLST